MTITKPDQELYPTAVPLRFTAAGDQAHHYLKSGSHDFVQDKSALPKPIFSF